jgi:hypothetical protein
MKFTLIALLALSSQAFSAEYLLKMTKGGGFAPIAMSKEVVVTEAGKIVATERRGTQITKTVIGSLSAAGLQILKDKIEEVPDTTKVVDLEPNRPGCMDAPSTRISINKGGKDIEIAAVRACKKFAAAGSFTAELTKVAESFYFLSK